MGIDNLLDNVRRASRKLTLVDEDTVKQVLNDVADALVDHAGEILEANAEDLRRMDLSDSKYDRLKLTKDRLDDMASCMADVACYPSPQGKVMSRKRLDNGLLLKKVRVPFGVVGVIYEARPNVTSDVFALCFKSGNACVLKGGHEADCSSRAIVRVIHEVLDRFGIDRHTVELLPPDREATAQLLHAEEKVDLIIPRGSKGLIEYVRREATVPVIETGAGVCHAYFDVSADLDKGTAIVCNAKTRRVSVCNALDCLLMNVHRLADLPHLCAPLAEKNVAVFADEEAYRALQDAYPSHLLRRATDQSFGTEFLDYKMAIRTVPDVDTAINHIEKYGSRHSESIITESKDLADYFCRVVDAACVYVNAPTSFTDGGQFGMGAEIGISTQKLHARGPMGLDELTTYKWVIEGNGQVRD